MLLLHEVKRKNSCKRGQKRKSISSPSKIEKGAIVGWNTLDGYACDVMDLWKTQHMLRRYPYIFPFPTRPPGEKALLLNATKEAVDKEIQYLVTGDRKQWHMKCQW